jgi:type I restriction enzyme M protein
MVREALRERFIQTLADAGGSAGNGRLLSELGWQEDTYLSVRDALLEDGTVVLGRGRGGSVRLASHDQTAATLAPRAAAPSPATAKTARGNGTDVGISISKLSGGKLTQSELERHLWQAADILRGTVDAGDYKQYIFGLLFYKRLCDVWDEEFEALLKETGDREEAADPDEHRFHIPAEHRWDQVRKQSTQIGQRLNNAFAAIEDANLRLRGVFGDVDFANQERFPDAVLEKLLSHFDKYRLRNADVTADVLGDAYMYLIKMFAEGSGKKGGEFYTPRQVARLIVECLDPQPGMSIYDPTGGSGGLLLEAVQHLKNRGEDPRSLSLYGQEKNLGTWAIAQMNLFLHDIDDAFIARGDTILSPKRYDPKAKEFVAGVGVYDRVMANPPFSEKVWGYEVWANGDPFGRDAYGCPPKSYGDLAFVQHMVASLKDDGMLGVVVPHGVLFRGGSEGRIREAMLKADIIEAVIGLAPNLFYGAGIPAAILIIRKSKPKDREGKVLVVNGDATFQPGKAQNALTDANVKTLADAFHGFADIEKLARVVPVSEIEANGFNLNISRYVQTGADTEAVDVTAEVAKLQDLIAKRDEAEAVMFEHLKRLGYV